MPTLKEYLEANGITVSPDQRSKIGISLSKIDKTKERVFEDGFLVKDYDFNFLNSECVDEVIISLLKEIV